jgi:hypothetical protein
MKEELKKYICQAINKKYYYDEIKNIISRNDLMSMFTWVISNTPYRIDIMGSVQCIAVFKDFDMMFSASLTDIYSDLSNAIDWIREN